MESDDRHNRGNKSSGCLQEGCRLSRYALENNRKKDLFVIGMLDRAATFNFKDDSLKRDAIKSLHHYTYSSARVICKLRSFLNRLQSNPEDNAIISRFSQELAGLAQNADAWGFEDISRLAGRLNQVLIDLENGTQALDARVRNLCSEGLDMLALLVSNCEEEFQRRNSIVKLLASLAHTRNKI